MSEVNEKEPVVEKKPVPEETVKSSMEILSELFSTFDAEPPLIIKKEKGESPKRSKKSKKKHKHKEKKHKHKEKEHKKKSKKRKRSRSSGENNSSDDDSRLDLAKILIKQECQSPDKRIKLDNHKIKKENVSIKVKQEKGNVRDTSNKADQDIQDDQKNNENDYKIGSKDNKTSAIKSEKERDKGNNKSRSSSDNKIKIQNLKFSSIFKQTVLEIEKKVKSSESVKDNLSSSDNSNLTDLSEGEIAEEKKSKHKKKHKRSKSKEKKKDRHSRSCRKKEKDRGRSHSRSKTKKSHSHSHSHEKSYKTKDDKDDFYKKVEKYKEKDDCKSKYRENDRHKDKDDFRLNYQEDLRNKIERDREVREKDDYWERRHSKEDYPRREEREEKWSTKDRYRGYNEADRDRERDRRHKDHSKSRERDQIDKKKLLEIARKNAIQMMRSGSLPAALTLGPQAQEKVLAAIRAGGKTIEELTDFCKTLSKKEELGELSSVSEEENDSDTDKAFHHPFQIKDRPTSIIMNIKNSVPLPTKTSQERTAELRMQFPVSSGQQHRKTENEWVPVSPKKTEAPTPVTVTKPVLTTPTVPLAIEAPPPPLPITQPVQIPMPGPQAFPAPETMVDIGTIVSQRLSAMRKLQENPNDMQALSEMYKAQKGMQTWAESKQQPGQFTGSTGAQILSQAELSSGYQAWAKKDQLQNAAPVSGGMGMHLLQKMGWRPGEGLGKEKTGALEPLLLEVKLDKKGLVANEEHRRKQNKAMAGPKVAIKSLEGKHPVSLLGEYAAKRKLGAPIYELCQESGPDHKKTFLFKVILNGIEYKPAAANFNKKQAKKDAAELCLRQIGLLPPT